MGGVSIRGVRSDGQSTHSRESNRVLHELSCRLSNRMSDDKIASAVSSAGRLRRRAGASAAMTLRGGSRAGSCVPGLGAWYGARVWLGTGLGAQGVESSAAHQARAVMSHEAHTVPGPTDARRRSPGSAERANGVPGHRSPELRSAQSSIQGCPVGQVLPISRMGFRAVPVPRRAGRFQSA